eukprot:SAG11_NODE_7606_length_1122_cov_0.856305_1_plen_40_part_10
MPNVTLGVISVQVTQPLLVKTVKIPKRFVLDAPNMTRPSI